MRVRAPRIWAGLAFVVAILGSNAFAQTPVPSAVQKGLTWLQSQVQPDGSIAGEGNSIATSLQVRTEVLHTLSRLAAPPAALATSVAADAEGNNEYLARRIVALKAANLGVDALAVSLLANQAADGGWNLGDPFLSDATDTALALHALLASSRATPASITAALGYLVSARMPAGGWGTNGSDNAYVTALVLIAAHAAGPEGQAVATQARARLLEMRVAGHYGADFDNSLAFLALFAQSDDPAVNGPLLDAIRAAQSADGSWAQDPFVTAIALRALSTYDASAATLRGRVLHALTNSPIAGVNVTLGTVPPLTATTDALGVFQVAGIRPGTYPLTVAATGFGAFTVTLGFTTGQALDTGDLKLQPDAATSATMYGVVTRGDNGAVIADALVKITIGSRSFSAFTDANGAYRIDGLLAGEAHVVVTRSGFLPTTSDRTVAAGGIYDESPKMYPSTTAGAQLAGLIIDSETKAPIAGATVRLFAPNAVSTTTADTGRFGLTNLVAGTGPVEISAPGYFTADGTATLVAGTTVYTTIALPPTIPGTTARTLRGRVLDLKTRAPIAGAFINIFTGQISSTTTDAEGRFLVPGYRGGIIEINIAKDGYDGSMHIYGPDNPPADDLGDFFLTPDTVAAPLADLAIADIGRTSVIETAAGILGGTLDISVRNAGGTPVASPFQVMAFLDTNNDGAYTPGADLVLGQVTLTGPLGQLVGGASISGSIAIAGTAPFLNAPIFVWVDSGQSVIEGDETNNVRSTAAFCRLCGSSTSVTPIAEPNAVLEPEFATKYSVYNLGPPPLGARNGQNNPYALSSFVLPKKGDLCTVFFGGDTPSRDGALLAVRMIRDTEGHFIGFGRSTRTAILGSAGWGASYYGNSDLMLVTAWVGSFTPTGPLSNGLFQLKPTDLTPGKYSINPAYPVSNTVTSLVPQGYPGAGKLKSTVWPLGEWYSATLVPDGNGYVSFATQVRVTTSNLQGRPHGFSYVPRASQGFSKDSLVVSEWDAGILSAYEIDADGNPITATRRVMMRGFTSIAGSAFDPLSGDLILTKHGGNGNEQRTIAVRGFGQPAAMSDLTVSRAVAAIDTSQRATGLTVRVGNAGPGLSSPTSLGIFAVRNGTRGELLKSIDLDPLATNAFRDLVILLDTPIAVSGLMAIADPGEGLLECSRTNNTAVVAVQALQGTIEVATDLPSYAPGSQADVTVTVANPGAGVATYFVETTVIDAQGAVLSTLGRRPVDALAPAQSANVVYTWTVPTVVAGTYRVRSLLLNAANAVIGEDLQAVEILPLPLSPVVEIAVSTDKATYNPAETATATVRVVNLQANSVLSGHRVELLVKDAAGTTVRTFAADLPQITPLANVQVSFTIALAGLPAGAYDLLATVSDAALATVGSGVARITIASTVDTLAEVTGTLALSSVDVPVGGSLNLVSAVKNEGNAGLASLEMFLTILDPAANAVLQEWSQSRPLAQGATQAFDQTWIATPNAVAKPLVAILSIATPTGRRPLAQRAFTVREVPIRIATTVVTDKPGYDALETVTLTARAINEAGGRDMVSLRIALQVRDPAGNVAFTAEHAVAALPGGTTSEHLSLFDLGTKPPGAYTVESRVLDAAGAALATATGGFTVSSTEQTGAGVGAQLAVAPNPAVAGEPTVFSATFLNAGNAAVAGVPVQIVVRDGLNAVVATFAGTVTLPMGEPAAFGASWSVPFGQAPGEYVATLSATIGGVSRAFGEATLTILPPPATATLSAQLGTQSRVAVLVSCAVGGTGNGTSNTTVDDPACVVARKSVLSEALTALGIVHAITSNDAEFRALVRCGRYNTYWITGGADKLSGTLAEEVREAVARGDSLIIDGNHDNRSQVFDAIAGVNIRGRIANSPATVTLSGALGTGTRPALGTHLRTDASTTSAVQARFANGLPAIVTSGSGVGKGAFFAYDLTATLQAAPADLVRRELLGKAIGFLKPDVQPGAALLGTRALIEVSIANLNVAATYRVEVTGFGAAFSEDFALAANATRVLAVPVQLPASGTSVTYTVLLYRLSGGSATLVETRQVTATLVSAQAVRDTALSGLRALSFASASDASARDRAVLAVETGWTLAQQGSTDAAIREYMKAQGELAKIAGTAVAPHELAIARLIQAAGLSACPTNLP